ncbi:helix-turn-helix domain-containing protein [Sphingobacterium siyangense]
MGNKLLTTKEAARFLNYTEGTLAVWRCNGTHDLPFIKIGHRIRYRTKDLADWLNKQLIK